MLEVVAACTYSVVGILLSIIPYRGFCVLQSTPVRLLTKWTSVVLPVGRTSLGLQVWAKEPLQVIAHYTHGFIGQGQWQSSENIDVMALVQQW